MKSLSSTIHLVLTPSLNTRSSVTRAIWALLPPAWEATCMFWFSSSTHKTSQSTFWCGMWSISMIPRSRGWISNRTLEHYCWFLTFKTAADETQITTSSLKKIELKVWKLRRKSQEVKNLSHTAITTVKRDCMRLDYYWPHHWTELNAEWHGVINCDLLTHWWMNQRPFSVASFGKKKQVNRAWSQWLLIFVQTLTALFRSGKWFVTLLLFTVMLIMWQMENLFIYLFCLPFSAIKTILCTLIHIPGTWL